MMRTLILSVALITLVATPAFATIGGPGNGNGGKGPKTKIGYVRAVNGSELDVEVSINGNSYAAVEPGGFVEQAVTVSGKTDVVVDARLLAAPGVSGGGVATVQADKTTVASISASTAGVSVSFSKPSQVARLAREAGVALASTGGLLPLLWLGMLLGRRPQRRKATA